MDKTPLKCKKGSQYRWLNNIENVDGLHLKTKQNKKVIVLVIKALAHSVLEDSEDLQVTYQITSEDWVQDSFYVCA